MCPHHVLPTHCAQKAVWVPRGVTLIADVHRFLTMCWHCPKHLHVLPETSQHRSEVGNMILSILFMKK